MYAQQGRADQAEEFGGLYARYRARLVAYCRRRLGHGDDADDAAHEALLRAFQAWGRFDRAQDPWPWLATIASRVCTDMRRRSTRPPAVAGREPSSDVHDLAMSRMRTSIIEGALEGLPARYRNALMLKEFAGWSYRDIAELEGTSMASVRSNIMRSRRSLGARVEAVARSRGQWPLPVAVPSVAGGLRDRLRTWRHGVLLTLDRTLVVTGLAFAMHPVAMAAAPVAAAAAVGGLTGAAAEAPAPVATPQARGLGLSASVAVSGKGLGPPAPAVGHVAQEVGRFTRETLTGVSSPQPTVGNVTVGAEVVIDDEERALWIRAQAWAETPESSHRHGTDSTLACEKNRTRRELCDTAVETLRPLPEH